MKPMRSMGNMSSDVWAGIGQDALGHDVEVQPMVIDGAVHGIEYRHRRPDSGAWCNGWAPVKPFQHDGWDLLSTVPLTLSPSLLCRLCGHHGWIRDGRWVSA